MDAHGSAKRYGKLANLIDAGKASSFLEEFEQGIGRLLPDSFVDIGLEIKLVGSQDQAHHVYAVSISGMGEDCSAVYEQDLIIGPNYHHVEPYRCPVKQLILPQPDGRQSEEGKYIDISLYILSEILKMNGHYPHNAITVGGNFDLVGNTADALQQRMTIMGVRKRVSEHDDKMKFIGIADTIDHYTAKAAGQLVSLFRK